MTNITKITIINKNNIKKITKTYKQKTKNTNKKNNLKF